MEPPINDRRKVPLGVVYQAETLGFVSVWFSGGRTDVVTLLVGPDNPPTFVAGEVNTSNDINSSASMIVRPGEYWLATSKRPDKSGVVCMWTPFG